MVNTLVRIAEAQPSETRKGFKTFRLAEAHAAAQFVLKLEAQNREKHVRLVAYGADMRDRRIVVNHS